MKDKLFTLLKSILLAVLGLVLTTIPIALYVLQDLTHKKAGVNHHIMFKNTYYQHRYFTPAVVSVLPILGLVLAGLILAYYIIKLRPCKNTRKIFVLFGFVYCLGLSALGFGVIANLLIYAYAIIGALVGICISLIGIGLSK